VHLPVETEELAVGIDDDRRVVIEAAGALLKERGDDHDLVFLRQLLEGCGARAGDALRELEIVVVLALAEILRAEELLGANDLGTLLRGLFGQREGLLEVFGRRRSAGVLQ
jgi:hypothetical protein